MTAASTGPAVHAAALALHDRIASLGGRADDEAGCRALVAAAIANACGTRPVFGSEICQSRSTRF
jgi:hypothetical protein